MSTEFDVTALASQLTGPIFLPGDPGYDLECATFNLNSPLTPAIVVGAASVRDVQLAIRFATGHGLAVAVRGGGHLQPRTGEGQLMLTLDRMTSWTVDASRASVRVTGSPRWGQLMAPLAAHGLAAMNGSSPHVGVVGYLLGGGLSPVLARSHGYASDHVTAIEVVTADGELRRATEHSDLFFALRGAKGNLGVVTAVEFGVFPIPAVYGGGLWFPVDRLATLLPAWRDWAPTLPERAGTSLGIQRLPDLPGMPEPLRGAAVVHLRYSYVGGAAEGEALLTPMRGLGDPVFDTVTEMPYAASGTIHNDPPEPLPYFDLGTGLRWLPDAALAALVELTGPDSGCPLVNVEIRLLGGALDRAPDAPDAVPTRGLPYQFTAFGIGGPEQAGFVNGWLTRVIEGMRPWADPRQMLNFISPEAGLTPGELRGIYGADLYDRVVAVKEKYDPANTFRVNHNLVRA
ncbi:FAD-binding oxidoreductase [Actinoplanes sp. L3-i22]|uniref:FAD-binding oxidoreductase n=1 Tax=Actinoplanes sp. L3-i22 TaxID=2836373 RepID=UPI001C746873|nr:FAD-binding protein [Actinoplanes sp. L3-i22]BCY09324.1 oxidoreductase [Actinoplanes sp. L3-i22]